MRERLTITLDAALLASIDTLIDKRTLRNRSQTIEHLLKEGLSLHELQQAVLFFEEDWSTTALSYTLTHIQQAGIRQVFLGLPSGKAALRDEVDLALQAFRSTSKEDTSYTVVPSDFGSGGTLLLQHAVLTSPFLIAWVGEQPPSLPSLIPLYVFHRQHNQPLTVVSQQAEPVVRLAIASPELLLSIPPGVTSLRQTVFPNLIKDGKVRGYLSP